MAQGFRHPTAGEIKALRSASEHGVIPTSGNLLLVMGLYAIAGRLEWQVADDDHFLDAPSIEALKVKATSLGREASLWPEVFSYTELGVGKQVDPLADRLWGPMNRFGTSLQGSVGPGVEKVKLRCFAPDLNTDSRSFLLEANMPLCSGKNDDLSVKLQVRFAEGFSRIAHLVSEAPHGQEEAWEFLVRNCDEGSDLIGSADILEAGWRT